MSGLYLPGMEMPKSCFECNLKKIWEDGVQCLVNKGLWMDCDSKHKACPLIPVPEHGRLIDADALITKVTDAAIKQPEIADVYYEQASEIGGWLYSMPTIIPADKEGEG